MKRKLFLILALCIPMMLGAKQKPLDQQALDAMKTATEYMMGTVGYNGGFVWNYLPDLSRQWGEMEAKRTMVWTQSPGTPGIGHLMLDAYHATGDEYYYEMAKKVAGCLIWGQLDCGGWNYCFDFAGEESLKDWYATVGKSGWRLEEFQHYYGNATFDDSATTDCAKFILRVYAEKYDPMFLPSLEKALNFVLESQYPAGGWPQRYPLKYDHPFEGRADYSSFITLNDSVIPEATDFLLQCMQVLGKPSLKEPILRAMRLIIVLQQGKPYAGWSDQYTVEDLKPAQARSYEPMGISSSTTSSMIRLLEKYYTLTGDSRFLAGIPAALDYLESKALPDSELARIGRKQDGDNLTLPRFVNPIDGKPYYMHRVGSNSYNGHYYADQDITNTIGHYGSTTRVNVKALRQQYEELLAKPVEELTKGSPLLEKEVVPLDRYYHKAPRPFSFGGAPVSVEDNVRSIIDGLTAEGCWLSPLRTTSNPYKAGADRTPSNETKYCGTNVGDEYDTSPYSNRGSEMCISTQDYISKMSTLLHFVANE